MKRLIALSFAVIVLQGVAEPKPKEKDEPTPIPILKEPNQITTVQANKDPTLVDPKPKKADDAPAQIGTEEYQALTNRVEELAGIVMKFWEVAHREKAMREKIHGRILGESTDIEKRVKTTVYEDGYQWCESFEPKPTATKDPEAELRKALQAIDEDPTIPPALKQIKKERALIDAAKAR